MSYDVYYTIKTNKKSYHYVNTLFFGKQRVYDYKTVINKIFDTFQEAIDYINNHYDFYKVHVRRNASTSSGFYTKDYIYRKRKEV